MLVIKIIILLLIFIISIFLGFTLANKYKYRVNDLKEIRSALNILKTKISYTYEPLPEVFLEIGKKLKSRNSENFLKLRVKK